MTSTSSTSKLAYMYDQQTDTWYPIGGAINTGSAYTWTSTQTFAATVDAQSVLNARAGINNFLNPAARDSIISSPTNGVVAFVRQDASGNVINQIQYYYNGVWREYNDSASLDSVTSSRALAISDAGRTIRVGSSSDVTITIPLNSTTPFVIGQRIEFIRKGSGEVIFAGETSGVIINSKNSNKKIAAQYSGAVLVKDDTNTWILIGDLKA
jgi:hypothetical protein